jgi:hypothetical protein
MQHPTLTRFDSQGASKRSSADLATAGLRSHCGRPLVRFNGRLLAEKRPSACAGGGRAKAPQAVSDPTGTEIGQVNSHRDSWLLERDFWPEPASEGEQPRAQNGGIPGLQRGDRRAERVSPEGILAEGEELSSNPLRRVFNGLQSTPAEVDVAWRIFGRAIMVCFDCTAHPPPRRSNGLDLA